MTKIFLKSRFFLTSNTRKSLITYIYYKVNYLIMYQSIFLGNLFMILIGLRLNNFFKKYKLNCGLSNKKEGKNWKKPKNCSKIAKKSLYFPLFGKKTFLNQTLGLRKSFLNQTTYVLKNRLYQQSFINRDSFLNRAFLNRDSTDCSAQDRISTITF